MAVSHAPPHVIARAFFLAKADGNRNVRALLAGLELARTLKLLLSPSRVATNTSMTAFFGVALYEQKFDGQLPVIEHG
jgi:hypothetical protein